MGVDADAAQAALSDIADRSRQVRAVAVRAAWPWWYMVSVAALLVLVGIVADLDPDLVASVFCAIGVFSAIAQTRLKIQLPLAVWLHWTVLLTSLATVAGLAASYFAVKYLATRAGLPAPGTAGGLAMAVAFLAHAPLFRWATRKAVEVSS